MISTGWGAPGAFLAGFNPAEAATRYSSAIHVWSWSTQSLVQTLELGDAGRIPLEVRFLHEPTAATAYVGAALSSNLLRVSPAGGAAADGGNKGGGQWAAEVAFAQPWTPVTGWALPEMPPLITDLLISLDDRWLILSNWLRGDLVLLDISDRAAPRLASRLWLGGSIVKGEGVVVTGGEFAGDAQPARPAVKGVPLQGGPQMIQLSLDGRRLYVTNSLFSSWDRQFYPELARRGSQLVRVLVDGDAGTLALDPTFLVDFGAEPGGAALAHEIRFPEGDCTSDIWLKA